MVLVVASVTMITLGAMLSSAYAGGVRIGAINNGGRSVLPSFSVTCEYPDVSESNATDYSVWTGGSTVVNGFNKFFNLHFIARRKI